MTEKSRSRLYGLTSLACIFWLVQSSIQATNDGTLLSAANIFFSVCLLVVIAWTGYISISTTLKQNREEDSNEENSGKDTHGENSSNNTDH